MQSYSLKLGGGWKFRAQKSWGSHKNSWFHIMDKKIHKEYSNWAISPIITNSIMLPNFFLNFTKTFWEYLVQVKYPSQDLLKADFFLNWYNIGWTYRPHCDRIWSVLSKRIHIEPGFRKSMQFCLPVDAFEVDWSNSFLLRARQRLNFVHSSALHYPDRKAVAVNDIYVRRGLIFTKFWRIPIGNGVVWCTRSQRLDWLMQDTLIIYDMGWHFVTSHLWHCIMPLNIVDSYSLKGH